MRGTAHIIFMLFLVIPLLFWGQEYSGHSSESSNRNGMRFRISGQQSAPQFLKDTQNSGGWEDFEIFYIDRYFNIINNGLTRIFADLNGRKFLLTTYPEELRRGDNTFLIPRQDTVVIDIINYLIKDDFTQPTKLIRINHNEYLFFPVGILTKPRNLIRLHPQGPTGSDATIIIGDATALQGAVDFVLELTELPTAYSLTRNYPNPFNRGTVIQYTIPENLIFGEKVGLVIYNILGQKIKTLVNERQYPGEFSVRWDGTTDHGQITSTGIYLYVLEIGDYRRVKKMNLIR